MPNTEHKPTERVLNILELLAATPSGLSLSDVAKNIGSPKTTIVPILHTMASRNFITFHKDTNLYTIGIGAYLAGSSYYGEKSIMQFIKSQMEYAVHETNEICQFGIRSEDCVLYIAKVDSTESIRLVSSVGKRLPLYCTALGKALLYQVPFEKVKSLYPNGLTQFTEHTIDSFDRLKQELDELNAAKFAHEKMEISTEICCYAVPICCNQRTIASLSISVPAFRDTEEKAERIREVLKNAGNTIEQYMFENHLDENAFCMYDEV